MTDRYQIIRLIRKDQLGGVYLAQDTEIDREVAFRNFDIATPALDQDQWLAPFSDYTAKLCAVKHPNLRAVHEAIIDGEHAILISEDIDAEILATQLQHGRLSVFETANMAIDLLSGMQAAHSAGMFHGAMHTGSVKCKPLAQGGHQYIVNDLGHKYLSSLIKGEETHLEDPVLIAPEQHGEPFNPTAQGDLYTIGQLCYTGLIGGHPFAEYSASQCAKAYKAGKIPSLRKFNSEVPQEFISWIMHMLARTPEKRFKTAEEALSALKIVDLSQLPPPEDPNLPAPDNSGESPPPVSVHTPRPKVGLPPQAQRRPIVKVVWATAVLLVISAISLTLWLDPFSSSQPSQEPTYGDNEAEAVTSTQTDSPAKPKENSKATAEIPARLEPKAVTPPSLPVVPAPLNPDRETVIKLHPVELINSIKQRRKYRMVQLDPPNTLDWLFTTGAPASSQFSRKQHGQYIGKISATGKFTEFAIKNNPIRFKTSHGIKAPRAATDTKHQLKKGQGWEVTLHPPEQHAGPLWVTFYLIQWNCDIALEITSNQSKRPVDFKIPAGTPGVVKVPLEIPHSAANETFRIKLLVDSINSKSGTTIGLNGIQVSDQPIRSEQKPQVPAKETGSPKTPKGAASQPAAATEHKVFQPALAKFENHQHFHSDQWFHAEGSIIKVAEKQYCLFYSRWPKDKSIHARITHAQIALATSSSPSGPWTYQKTILTGRSNHWDQFGVTQPVVKMFEGKYYLYYVSTSASISKSELENAAKLGGKNISWRTLNDNRCIGVARADSLKGPWLRLNKPIIKAKAPYYYFSCSPSVTLTPDGQYLMMVCSMSAKGSIISYAAKSTTPHFQKITSEGNIPAEVFSVWYNPSTQIYQYVSNGDANDFHFYHTSELTAKLTAKNKDHLPKPKNLLPNKPLPTLSFQSPNLFFGDDGTPEVFIFYSDDSTNGGIFTIPFQP